MRSYIRNHLHAMRRAIAQFVAQPGASLISLSVIGVALSLPLGLHLLIDSALLGASRLDSDPQVNVFLQLDATLDDAKQVEKLLLSSLHARSVKFVPKNEALAELKMSGGLVELLSSIEGNPLPHAFVVQPADRSPEALERMRGSFATLPKVELISADLDWARKLSQLRKLGTRLAGLTAMLIGFAVAIVVANTIRLQILSRREEIEVSQLIGATRAFIRRPFLYHGTLQGLIGGAFAAGLASAAIGWLNIEMQAFTTPYLVDINLRYFKASEFTWILLVSAALGWLGSYFSVSLQLKRFRMS